MMDETGLKEVSAELSAFWGLIKRKIHLSKQEIRFVGGVSDAGDGAASPDGAARKTPGGAAAIGLGGADKIPDGAITSPMVGVVYLAPDPTAKPFVSVGAKVVQGETLCLIEAMKTFNPIKSPKDGVVAEIFVGEGETVEFGAPLLVVK